MSSTEWARAVEAYLRHLQAAGSPYGTIRLRRHWLGHVACHVGVAPWEVTPAQLVDFLSAARWRPETRKSARTTIRSFYTWALDHELTDVDPSRRLPTVRIPTALPKPCPDEVIQAALARADPDERLMLLLAATAGLRIHEIAKVARRDVQHRVDGYALDVLGKGGKQRLIPLSDSLAAELLARPDGYVFGGQVDGHFAASWVGCRIKRLLGPHHSAHGLRHRFATVAYSADRDLLSVQQLLGHSRPETTARYTALAGDALRTAAARAAM